MPLSTEEKRIWIKGLLIRCPLKREIFNCPLCEIRKMPAQERMEWVNGINEEQINGIVEHHQECLAARMG